MTNVSQNTTISLNQDAVRAVVLSQEALTIGLTVTRIQEAAAAKNTLKDTTVTYVRQDISTCKKMTRWDACLASVMDILLSAVFPQPIR